MTMAAETAASSSSTSSARNVLFRRHRNRRAAAAAEDNDQPGNGSTSSNNNEQHTSIVPLPHPNIDGGDRHEQEEGNSNHSNHHASVVDTSSSGENIPMTTTSMPSGSGEPHHLLSYSTNLGVNNIDNYPNNNNNNINEEDEEQQELVVQVPRRERYFAPPPMATDLNAPAATTATVANINNNTGMLPPAPFVFSTLIGGWTHPSDEVLAIRREAIHREIERVQRSNFIHFILLCMIPTALLLIVIVAIMSERGECGSSSTTSFDDNNNNDNLLIQCYREPRTFVNAFTSTCICNAIRVAMDADADEEN